MYVYKIKNKLNGRLYIGQTIKTIKESKNYYGSGKLIQIAIKKYGIENFEKSILCECKTQDELNEIEIFYIKKYNSIICGYNIAPGGNVYSHWIGKTFTEKHKKKIGVASSSWLNDNKKNINFLNSMRSKEIRKKISERMKDNIPWNKGKTNVYSEESIEKMSESAKHRNINEETENIRREKISIFMKESHPNSIKIIDTRDNKIYKNIKIFCNENNISWYKLNILRKNNIIKEI